MEFIKVNLKLSVVNPPRAVCSAPHNNNKAERPPTSHPVLAQLTNVSIVPFRGGRKGNLIDRPILLLLVLALVRALAKLYLKQQQNSIYEKCTKKKSA